eukprot:scaffold118833_cov32-Tisochrysis_lutea.AAC.1
MLGSAAFSRCDSKTSPSFSPHTQHAALEIYFVTPPAYTFRFPPHPDLLRPLPACARRFLKKILKVSAKLLVSHTTPGSR